MAEKNVQIKNPTGLHARPASLLVAEANKFKSKVELRYGDKLVNARSVLSVLGAGIKSGDEVTIVAEGEDAQAAVDGLVQLIESFDE